MHAARSFKISRVLKFYAIMYVKKRLSEQCYDFKTLKGFSFKSYTNISEPVSMLRRNLYFVAFQLIEK